MVIVNLAIEYHSDCTIFIANRLLATFHVNDAEPPHPHRNAGLDKIAGGIRAAMVDRVAHPLKSGARKFTGSVNSRKSSYAAHDKISSRLRFRLRNYASPSFTTITRSAI